MKDISKDVLEAKTRSKELIIHKKEHDVIVPKWKDILKLRLLTTTHALELVNKQDARNLSYLSTNSS